MIYLTDRAYRQSGTGELLIQRHYGNHILQFYKTKKVKEHYCAMAALKKGHFFVEKGLIVKLGGARAPSAPSVPTSGVDSSIGP